jgi:hypothetical protein
MFSKQVRTTRRRIAEPFSKQDEQDEARTEQRGKNVRVKRNKVKTVTSP